MTQQNAALVEESATVESLKVQAKSLSDVVRALKL